MINNTGNNDPAPEQQNEHQQTSTENHVTQELHDADALKEKLKSIFDRNYQYYIKKELKDRVIPTKAKKYLSYTYSKMQMKLPVPTYSQWRTSHLEKLTVQSTV